MNEYLKQYIELQKQFRETKGNPDSVRALYTFKEKLEQSEDKQAKEVLVDVYDLLDFKKDAYELLCQIGNRSDKKTLKRLGTLKEYAENWGNHYALPRPKTPEEKQKEKERQAQLGLPQPVEKGHLSVVFFSYKERECGILVWGDKNAGKERRKQRTTGICKFGKHGAAGSLAAEDRRCGKFRTYLRIGRRFIL